MPTAEERPLGLRLRRWAALPRRERREFLEAWWRLAVAAVRLRLAPARTVRRALEPPPARPSEESAAGPVRSAELARAVSRAAAHHLGAMACLPRALALESMLARRRIPARLRIGVRRDGAGVAAHAWVEVDGRPLGEPEAIDERFLPFVEPEP